MQNHRDLMQEIFQKPSNQLIENRFEANSSSAAGCKQNCDGSCSGMNTIANFIVDSDGNYHPVPNND